MTQTTSRGYPHPEATDANDVPAQMQALAEKINGRPGISPLTTAQRDALSGAELWDGRVILNLGTLLLETWDAELGAWVLASADPSHDHDAAYVNESDHGKPEHDALDIDADTVDGLHAAEIGSSALATLLLDASSVVVSNSTTETDLVAVTVAAGTLGANGGVLLRVGGSLKNSSGATESITFRVRFGATIVLSTSVSLSSATQPRAWKLDVILQNVSATNQRTLADLVVTPSSSINWIESVGAGARLQSRPAASSEDTAADQDIKITAEPSAADIGLLAERMNAWVARVEPS